MQLAASHISVALGKDKKPILNDVSFIAPDGCFVSLLGPSGAGKSTLLKIIAGTLEQDQGSISVDEQPLEGVAAQNRNLGFVYQDIRLFPHMTVGENVGFGLKIRGVKKEERAKRVADMLERVQLGGMESRYPRELSGGQAQRVAFARTLICEPRVLLLDEPFSGLDELLRDDMRSLILSLHRETGITTIMVTHDAIEALELSDRIVYLADGRVFQQGTPRELFETPASAEVAASFGDCSTIHGSITNGSFTCAGLRIPDVQLKDGPATAVIRFSSVTLQPESTLLHLGNLPVRCGVYRGNECLTRFELNGQVLTVPTESVLPAQETFDVYAHRAGVFVFNDEL